MKFSWKVFISTILLVTAAFGLGGTAMIVSLYHQLLEQETLMAMQENRYLCFSFGNALSSVSSAQNFDPDDFLGQIEEVLGSLHSEFSVGAIDTIRLPEGEAFAEQIPLGSRSSRIVTNENGIQYIQIVTHVSLSEYPGKGISSNFQDTASLAPHDYYLQNIVNISSVYETRNLYIALYQGILLAVISISSVILLLLTHFLTLPLKRLTATTQEIASGSFSTRAVPHGNDEIGILTKNFNIMADVVEEKIYDLEETARQREDFVASFAHELKTPLTSIIGYADMLRSYEMSPEDRFTAANYIFSEGKRLESLSLHLLDLIVLHKQEFHLSPVESEAFLQETAHILMPLLQKHQQTLHIQSQPATILLEAILMKTLLYNLIDNACKASEPGSEIFLTGEHIDGFYRLSVRDCGRGIPAEELSKITEPFYMVDKSRSRKQNGAGLGLALCQEIAMIHGDSLHIQSQLGQGTCISFSVKEVPCDEK